jgi:hypothetical protein
LPVGAQTGRKSNWFAAGDVKRRRSEPSKPATQIERSRPKRSRSPWGEASSPPTANVPSGNVRSLLPSAAATTAVQPGLQSNGPRAKTISPFEVQDGDSSRSALEVIRVGFVPSRLTTQMSKLPAFAETKAIFDPSGEKRGVRTAAPSKVSRRRFEPSRPIT